MLKQDLHIHTIFSVGDSAVVPEQTPQFIASLKHAEITGISDHLEYLVNGEFEQYKETLEKLGLHVGVEVNGYDWIERAKTVNVEYYIFHCQDRDEDYEGLGILLNTGKPVIVAHPQVFTTNLNRVPAECYLEINNRYVWRYDWQTRLAPYVDKFRFIMSSDAHQPNWLNQTVSRYVSQQLQVKESIIF